MANAEHLKILKEGVERWNRWRAENPDVSPDLFKADLIRVKLAGANLKKANLRNADLRGASLTGADLTESRLAEANLTEADLSRAILTRAVLSGALLQSANLTGANLINANLYRAQLSGAELAKADFTGCYMMLADLTGSNLSYANLAGVDLADVKLLNTNLTGANLNHAKIFKEDLAELNLSEEQISAADWLLPNIHAYETDFFRNALKLASKGFQIKSDSILQFESIYPSPFHPNTWQDMLVYVYYKSALEKVIADFERRKQQLAGEFTGTSAESQAHIPPDSLITIIPDIPSVVCEPPSFQFRMTDDYHCQPFRVMHKTTPVLEKLGRGRIKGAVRIYLETLVIGEIPVESEWEAPGYVAPIQPTMVSSFAAQPNMMAAATGDSFKRQTAQAFRKIFASFSESDKPIIERLEKAYKALGDDYWSQYQRLRAGQDKSKAIEEAIQDSDVFQLCWSNNAKTAENVEREWRLALALSKEDFIRPIYWEKPMPEPPEELQHLYFDYYQVET